MEELMFTQASEAGAKPKEPAKNRNRSLPVAEEKAMRSVLHRLTKLGMIETRSAYNRAKAWLGREARGSEVDLRSPFFSIGKGKGGGSLIHEPRSSVVKRFWNAISKVSGALPPKFLTIVLTTERKQADSIGPQSKYLPWYQDGPEKVLDIWKDKPMSYLLDKRALRYAVERVQSLIPLRSVGTTSIQEAIGTERSNPFSVNDPGMDITTNSGFKLLKSPWKPRPSQEEEDRRESEAAFKYILERAGSMKEILLTGDTVNLWAIQAKRLAQKALIEKVKRLVIAIEKAEPVLWKTFTPELLLKLSQLPQFCALLDLPHVDRNMQRVLLGADKGGRSVISGDYSGYDASLPPWLIELAGKIVSRWVRGGETWIQALTKSMVENVTLVTPNKIWLPRPSSMKSGSGGTNLLDSLCNLIVIYYGEEIGAYKVVDTCVQGDDFILDAIGANPQAIHQVASHFGLEAHPTKQMYEPHVLQFCQRLHFSGYLGGMASVMRTLGSIMSYERLTFNPKLWGPYADIIRATAQLENTVFNPYFETLVNFVAEGDKYRLGGGASPGELMRAAGPVGVELLQKHYSGPGKTIRRDEDIQEQFNRSAVCGVLNGEVVPPLGSEARFSYAYGKRV